MNRYNDYLQEAVAAARILLVREAEGVVTTFDGSPYDVFNDRIVARNGLIHDEMVAMLAAVASGSAE